MQAKTKLSLLYVILAALYGLLVAPAIFFATSVGIILCAIAAGAVALAAVILSSLRISKRGE